MNEALNEAVYGPFRFIEWDIILASIHSLFKGSIQPSNVSYCSPTQDEAINWKRRKKKKIVTRRKGAPRSPEDKGIVRPLMRTNQKEEEREKIEILASKDLRQQQA